MRRNDIFLNSIALLIFLSLIVALPLARSEKAPPPSIPKPKDRTIDPISKSYFELGKQLYYRDEFKEAILNLKQALKREPNLTEGHLFLGKAYLWLELYPDAEQALKKAIHSQVAYIKSEAHRLLGHIYSEQDKFDEAERNYRISLDIDSSNTTSLNALAYLYAVKGVKLKEALRLMNKLIDMTGPEIDRIILFYYLDTRAWIHYKVHNYKQAEKDASKSQLIAKGYLKKGRKIENVALKEGYYHMGEIYRVQNKNHLARKYFQKALKIDRNYADAKKGLSKIP